ncbi:unnamed protein product, partial [Prorocentrum cordatum]
MNSHENKFVFSLVLPAKFGVRMDNTIAALLMAVMDLMPVMTMVIWLVIDVVETAIVKQEASLEAQVLALVVHLIFGRLAMVIRGLAVLFAKPSVCVGLNVAYVVVQWLLIVLEVGFRMLLSFQMVVRFQTVVSSLVGFLMVLSTGFLIVVSVQMVVSSPMVVMFVGFSLVVSFKLMWLWMVVSFEMVGSFHMVVSSLVRFHMDLAVSFQMVVSFDIVVSFQKIELFVGFQTVVGPLRRLLRRISWHRTDCFASLGVPDGVGVDPEDEQARRRRRHVDALGILDRFSGSPGHVLEPGPHPHDPHADDFVPRPSEGAGLWDFGRAHAAVQHALGACRAGNATATAEAFEDFSAAHGLGFGLGAASGQAVDGAVRAAAAAAAPREGLAGAPAPPTRGLRALVLRAGLGGGSLRCAASLLALGADAGTHELVSVEMDPHLSSGAAQLVQHAIGSARPAALHHTALLPGDDTALAETLESLADGYDLDSFDVVLLARGDRALQREQLATLLRAGAVRHGTVVHAEGPGSDDPGTKDYMEDLHWARGRGGKMGSFSTQSHGLDGGRLATVSVFSSSREEKMISKPSYAAQVQHRPAPAELSLKSLAPKLDLPIDMLGELLQSAGADSTVAKSIIYPAALRKTKAKVEQAQPAPQPPPRSLAGHMVATILSRRLRPLMNMAEDFAATDFLRRRAEWRHRHGDESWEGEPSSMGAMIHDRAFQMDSPPAQLASAEAGGGPVGAGGFEMAVGLPAKGSTRRGPACEVRPGRHPHVALAGGGAGAPARPVRAGAGHGGPTALASRSARSPARGAEAKMKEHAREKDEHKAQQLKQAADLFRSAQAQFRRAQTAGAAEEYAACVRALSEAIALRSNHAPYYQTRGRCYVEMQQYQLGLMDFSMCVRLEPETARHYGYRGFCYWRLGRDDEALRDYDAAIRLEAKGEKASAAAPPAEKDKDAKEKPQAEAQPRMAAQYYFERAMVYTDREQYDKAVEGFQQAAEKRLPTPYKAYLHRGICLRKMDKLQESIMSLQQAIHLEPSSGDAHNHLGLSHIELGAFDEAKKCFASAIENDPCASFLDNRGLANYHLERYEEAVEDFSAAVEADPNDSSFRFNRGNARFKLGQHEEALVDYGEAIRLEPDNPTYLHHSGLAYEGCGSIRDAILKYEEALERDSDHHPSRFHLGTMCHADGQYERALKAFNQSPPDEALYEARGLVHRDMGDFQRALDDFDRVVELKPEEGRHYYNRGVVYHRMGQEQDAIENLTKAVNLGCADAAVFSERGLAWRALGNMAQAVIDLTSAIEADGMQTIYLSNRAQCLFEQGLHDRAEADLTRALCLDERDPGLLYKRGIARYAQHRYADSIADLKAAVQRDPPTEHMADIYYHLGVSYANLGKHQLAVPAYDSAIEREPDKPHFVHERAKSLQAVGDHEK